eukprot:8371768-Prorocentrum_lima.AAC.1
MTLTTWPSTRRLHGQATQKPTMAIAPRPKPNRRQQHPPIGAGESATPQRMTGPPKPLRAP